MLNVSSIVWYRQPHEYDSLNTVASHTQQRSLVLLRMGRGVKGGVVVEEKSTFAKDQGENEW